MIVQLPCGNFFDLRTFSGTSTKLQSGGVILTFHLVGNHSPEIVCQNMDEANRVARDVIDLMQAADVEDSSLEAEDASCSSVAALRLNIERTISGLRVSPVSIPDSSDIWERGEKEAMGRIKKIANDDRRSKFMASTLPVGAPPFDPLEEDENIP